ncbi:MAG TPA: non-homologous end-joining DNA ligase [Solirubrobacteraceae bacterium]|nr:non-homologous end-joining DNA ligase [Solirubrobacteraceae bacterium]
MSVTIDVGGRPVKVSRPDKALFPCGITKLDLARHYDAVGARMVHHIADRPLTLERYPDGIEAQRIMQKRAGKYFPSWIARVTVPKKGGSVEHVRAADAATLVYLADQACITMHPTLSRRDMLQRPDRLVFDLDPSADRPDEVRRAARLIGDLLLELGLAPWAMTTGSRGYHVVVPLQRRLGFDDVRGFARDLAAVAESREPKLFTTEQRKANRGDRVLIDVMRNGYAQTSVAPYAVRARPGAPVATPLHWEELSDGRTRADRWTIKTIGERLEREGDPWQDIAARPATLTQARTLLAREAALTS